MTYSIPLILGTGREGRASEAVADFVRVCMQTDERIETPLIDVRDYPSPFTARVDEEGFDDKGLGETLKRAHGLVIVSPEYNHGYPGELKIFLDHYYPELAKKPVGICGVSNGPWGGTRMIESLRVVLTAFGAVSCQRAVMFPNVHQLFPEGGAITEAERVGKEKSVQGLLDEVVWYAEACAFMRREG